MYFEIYKDSQREWRWRLRASNNYIIADSSEGYNNKQDCIHAIDLVKSTNASTPVYED